MSEQAGRAATAGPLLRVDGLKKSFGTHEVLKGISLEVGASQVVGLLGQSGSGKSTLLRCLNMLEQPSAGRVYLDGEEIGFEATDKGLRRPLPPARLARQRQSMAMVFQHFNLWPHRTVLGNVVEGPRQVLGLEREEAEAMGLQLLDRVGLKSKAHEHPIRLSGGQQQRVGIARALAMRPKIMLFDEPTSALDPELVGEVLAVMLDLARDGVTMVVVTHEISFAETACDQILLLDGGRVIESGAPQSLIWEARQDRTKQFFANYRDIRQGRGS